MPYYLRDSYELYRAYGKDFPVCGNKECHWYGDTTPTTDEHSSKCLMCGARQVSITFLIKMQEV